MKFVDLKREVLTVTNNDITYTKEVYKIATQITGVTDETHGNWSSATTYSIGQYVVVPELKSIYRSTSDSNQNKFPLAYTDDWVFWGFLNSYSMFASDENIGAQTTGTDIVIILDFSQCNTLALLDIDFVGTANVVQVDNSDASEVYNKDIESRDISCSTFAQYCYDLPIKKKKKIIIDDLKWLPNSTVTITFSGSVSIGTLGIGILEDMGVTLYGTSLKWESKSLIDTDEYTGYRNVLRRGTIRVLAVKVVFNTDNFNTISQRLDEIIDRNILFIPTILDKFSELIQIGYMETFQMPINNPNMIETTTNIIGVNRL